jgi:general secretion pathway protein D
MPRHLLVLVLAAALAACTQPMRKSEGHLSEATVPPTGNIPAPVQTLPVLPKPRPMVRQETYSVVVNNVRVQELLFALARDAKVNVDIHPGISGLVTLNAIDQTLPQLLSRISKQVDMRYELDGPNLIVMPDSPYLRVYKIDYVNMKRETTGTVAVSGQITGQTAGGGGGGAGGGGGGGSTGSGSQNTSTVRVVNSSTNSFWDTLVDNIKDILRETDKILPAGPTPVAAAAPAPAAPGGGAGGGGAGLPAAPTAVPNVSFREAASVIANPEASVLTIRATARQHERIQEFLDQVLVNARRQVLIEATIVEVRLSNNYQQGIDWNFLTTSGGLPFIQVNPVGSPPGTPTQSLFTMNLASERWNFSATIKLLETFGNVRVLSSPRITALNNQTAVLRVVDNRVYFTITANTTQNQTSSLTTFTTTPNVVPVGFVMNITPQISETDNVVLNVKPSITRIVGFVNDPNPVLAALDPPVISRIPEIQTREMESILKLTSGQVAVMGGLIQDSLDSAQDTIPFVNRIPLIGDLFSNQNITNTKSELVIFMRPLVVKESSLDGDFRGYRTFLPGDDFMKQPHPARRPCQWPDIEGCPR